MVKDGYFDLANCVRLKQFVIDIAHFLCRPCASEREDRGAGAVRPTSTPFAETAADAR